MRFAPVLKVLGILIMFFSISMLPPIGVALYYGDGAHEAFVIGFFVTLICGFLCWFPFRGNVKDLKTRDGFLIVTLFWTVLSLFGAIPFVVSKQPMLSFTNAIFESVSGLTTTGATVITGLDYLPHGILYYRQQLHFLGGMGIVVLALAVLPMLGIGGMQLYRAETPGPIKDNKLTPRLTGTAKALWLIYVGLIVMCTVAFAVQGMSWFDALCESFSAVSTGGFSNHDASYVFYDNSNIEICSIIFMILGGTNFALHYQFFRYGRVGFYWKDAEFRAYIAIILAASLLTAGTLFYYHIYPDVKTTLLKSFFTIVSLNTTTGSLDADFSNWPTYLPFLAMMMAAMGGCAGSTSGGIKVIRILLLRRQTVREVQQLIHPKAVIPVRIGDQVLSPEIIQAIWSFLVAFIVLFIVIIMLLLAQGNDITTAFGATVAAISNSGAGIGQVSGSFLNLSDFSKWALVFGMLAGRLEIFSILVLFSMAYWRE
ncbi:MAG: TrkH family potassium uptake protein [Gammaproteobacteria bacterium]|nr:TrkH family potassium uptake protein [Gammaproteobacteria bacterium]